MNLTPYEIDDLRVVGGNNEKNKNEKERKQNI